MSREKALQSSYIVDEATMKQRAASDPMVSSWVGASAGSGKTKVLTDRILRLLLPRENGEPGTRAEKILALTFTKAAANEMALRLSQRLSAWAVMDERSLANDLENLLGRQPVPEERDAARKLFARVVDTPGGMKIMTIHSFCQSVLGRFPIEAGLAPNFKPLEEEEALELLEKSKRDTLLYACRHSQSPLGLAVANISTTMYEDQFSSLLTLIAGERYQFDQILKRTFGVDGLYTNLCQLLNVPAGKNQESAFFDFCTGADELALREVCFYLEKSQSVKDRERGSAVQTFLDTPLAARWGVYTTYKKTFFTSKNEIKDSFVSKPVLKQAPHLDSILSHEAERVRVFEELSRSIVCITTSCDLFRIAAEVLARYRKLKESRAALDFDDLILKTLSLLKGDMDSMKTLSVTPWIMYKLDEGLDHILVDEAQDTNPEQWEIIRLLSDEFFSGQGARDIVRSIFIVGDEKQSIFSFQRAAPEKFGEMYRWFEQKIKSSGERFSPVNINTSFRSVQIVLDLVDTVFENPQTVQGLGDRYLNHVAKRAGQGGLVELWPLLRSTETGMSNGDQDEEKQDGWFTPDRLVEGQSGSFKMASKIGDVIRSWLDQKEILQAYERPIEPGDIMILVRSRSAFVGQLVRALKTRKIPVSGVDRMILADQMVIKDLCTAAAFALLPDDDLALASLLKSPFIGMTESDLYDLAFNRTCTLWDSMKKNRDGVIINWLEKLIGYASQEHPYEFFSRIVQEPCPAAPNGMRAIRTRLGDDALDPLDEFLNTALTYEHGHGSGLQGFLKWTLETGRQIKRQMEEAGGSVRIMTVHGAKGLQAPIVFLPDTVRTAAARKPDRILWPHKCGLDLPLYLSSKETVPETIIPAREQAERLADEEYYRLLYVAMTRAEERLYIGGYTGKRGPGEESKVTYWYDNIKTAFERHGDVIRLSSGFQDDEGNDVPLLRISSSPTASPDKAVGISEPRATVSASLPPFAFKQAPAEPSPPRPLIPSRPSMAEPAAASPLSASRDFRFRRGTATHKLLQILPDLAPERRESAAAKFLARPALGLPPALQQDIAREIFTLLDDPVFRDLFGPGSMAEVPVTGLIGDHTLVSGQIDRIVIRDSDILIVDYKTNRPPPQDAKDVTPVYLRQMKAYADALKEIYPHHTVRCALLWTDGPRLMEIEV